MCVFFLCNISVLSFRDLLFHKRSLPSIQTLLKDFESVKLEDYTINIYDNYKTVHAYFLKSRDITKPRWSISKNSYLQYL